MISSSKTALHLLACAGALGLLLPAAAFAAPKAPSPIAGVCQAVMGLEPGQAQFEGCSESLASSLHDIGGQSAAVDARRACLDQGLALGTSSLAVCTVQGQDAPSARRPTLVDASTAPPLLCVGGVEPGPGRGRRGGRID